MADLTGASTDRLQSVAPALIKSGISLEKYADIIKDVNDKTNDFLQTGGGPMKDFFEQIAPKVGITKDAFKDLSGEQGLQLYVDSLEKAGLSQEQMTFYMEALASDSTMLLPLLQDNAAGLNEFADATKNAMSPETIKRLTDLTSNFDILRTSLTNIVANKFGGWIASLSGYLDGFNSRLIGTGTITSHFGEALDNVTLAMGDEIDQANKLFTLLGNGNTVTQSSAVSTLSQAKAHLSNAEAKYADAEAEKALQMVLLQRNLTLERDALKTIREGTDAYEDREKSIVAILVQMGELTSLTKGSAEQLALANTEVERIQTAIDGAVDGMVVFDGELVTANSLSERLSSTTSTMGMPTIVSDAQTLVEKLGISLQIAKALARVGGSAGAAGPDGAVQQVRDAYNMNDLISQGLASVTSYGPSTSSTGGGGGGGGGGSRAAEDPAAKLIEDSVNSMKSAAEAEDARVLGIGDTFIDGVSDSFASAMKTGDWKGFLDSTLDSFTSDVIGNFAKGLFGPLKDFLGDAIGGLMDSLSGSSGSGIWGALGTFFGAANGGIVPTTPFSTSYADSVPTMLQPGELVVPKSQVDGFLNGGSGGGSQTFNVNVSGDVSRQTRKEIVAMMPQIAAGTSAFNRERGNR